MAELVAKKDVQASELLDIALQRAKQTNPQLNAIIIPMHEHARQRTQTVLTGPFAGVPFLVKDLFQQYAGYPTSFGCLGLKRAHHLAEQNAEIVNRWENSECFYNSDFIYCSDLIYGNPTYFLSSTL